MNVASHTIAKRKEPLTFNLLDLLVVFYMAHSCLPAVGQFTPGIVFLGVFAMTALMLCMSRKNMMRSTHFTQLVFVFSLSLVTLVEKIFVTRAMADSAIYLYGQLQAFLYGWIALYYAAQKKITKTRRMLKIVTVFYVITIVTTYIGNIIYPQASRLLATFDSNNSTYQTFTKLNIGGFNFVYEVALFSALLVYLIKTKKIRLVYGIPILVVTGLFFLTVEYTTALSLFLASVSLLFIRRLTTKKVVTIVIIVLVLALLLGGVVASLLEELGDMLNSTTMSARFNYFAKILRGEDVGETEGSGDRMALYSKAIDDFVGSKFLGTWGETKASEHSLILDSMAKYGFIGIIALVVVYVTLYKLFVGRYKKREYYPYLVWMYIMAVILAILNPKLNQFVFIFMIPLFTRVIDYYTGGEKYDENAVDSK